MMGSMFFCLLMRVVTQSTCFTIVTCLHFVMGLKVREKNELLLVIKLIDTGSVHGVIYQCNLGNEIPYMKVFHEIPGFDRADFYADQVTFPARMALRHLCLSLPEVVHQRWKQI